MKHVAHLVYSRQYPEDLSSIQMEEGSFNMTRVPTAPEFLGCFPKLILTHGNSIPNYFMGENAERPVLMLSLPNPADSQDDPH